MTTTTMMMMMMMVEKYQNLNREMMQICGVLSLLSLTNWVHWRKRFKRD